MTLNEPGPPTVAAGLVRVRLDISYDGTDFAGWARQREQRTVQAVLEAALATVLRSPEIALTVAGRTDAGVHAIGQVAHFDVSHEAWDPLRPTLLRRLAGILPLDVRVVAITEISPDFDARFSALWRRYVYQATDAATGAAPLRRRDTLAWARPLDDKSMARAAHALLGEHNFAAFCRRRAGATSIRTLQALDVVRDGALVDFHVQADAFCYSMVRSLVGALLAVGDGRQAPEWPAALLARTARCDLVGVAPAHGLTLVEVRYPAPDDLAARARVTRQRRLKLAHRKPA